jgi:hypothetical protein
LLWEFLAILLLNSSFVLIKVGAGRYFEFKVLGTGLAELGT